jgi:hypothetical protein
MSVPIVILHIGNQPYFKNCVILNAKHNPVIVIGDESNKDVTMIKNVEHVPIDSLNSPELDLFKQHFVNYSKNNANYEYLCFARVFYVGQLMKQRGLEAIFHTDSDCIVLTPLDPIIAAIRRTHTVAYSLEQNANPFHMVGSIHNALLTPDFCAKFVRLCSDIYITKTKFALIEPKIRYHVENGVPGGICDMTLYYLLAKEKLLDVLDLNQLLLLEGTPSAFDHTVFCASGYTGEQTYILRPNTMKEIERSGDHYLFVVQGSGQRIRALSLHFQGHSKPHMLNIYKYGNASNLLSEQPCSLGAAKPHP